MAGGILLGVGKRFLQATLWAPRACNGTDLPFLASERQPQTNSTSCVNRPLSWGQNKHNLTW